eukprot:860224-Rhodomonas_salina.2
MGPSPQVVQCLCDACAASAALQGVCGHVKGVPHLVGGGCGICDRGTPSAHADCAQICTERQSRPAGP